MEYNNPNLNININPNQNRIKTKLNKKNQIPRMDIKTSNFNMMNSSKNSTKFLSSTTKKSQNQNYTIDSENNKRLFYSEEDNNNKNNNLIANEVRIQYKILEFYQKWINTLLSVLNNNENNNYDNIGTPIQQNLEDIEKLKEKISK